MAHKRVLFEAHARERVLNGARSLAEAVRVTLGPKSKRVLIETKWGNPLACDDGVTIAKEFSLADPEENMGVRMLRQVAERTGDAVGDGTTTSMLLAYAIFSEGIRNVVAGSSAIDIKRGLERGLSVTIKILREISRPVKSRKEKAQIAAISAHNDRQIGELVAEAIERVGDDGLVSVDDARATETTLEVVNGMQIDRGYASPYFVTDPAKMECVLVDPLILIHPQKISSLNDLIPFLEVVVKTGQPLLIIAEDVEGEALATLVVNKLRGTIACCAVKAPGYGDRRQALLEDIAILTGATVIAGELGKKLETTQLHELGRAGRVIVGKDTTGIIGGSGDKAQVQSRIESLRAELKTTKSQYDREKVEERLAKLAGGVAVIHAGAASETALKSIKDAFDDAIHATKAAIAEGIVPGSGLSLLRAMVAIEAEESQCTGDEQTGLRILKRALEAPTRQIARNSGLDDGVVIERMRAGSGYLGLDAASGRYVDLVESGIIDPTKVVRVALEHAVSVAGLLLLCEATLVEVPESTKHSTGHTGQLPED